LDSAGRGGTFEPADPPAYRTTRFVFVVQVLEAESFAPEE
jgi:hypothetical protein